MSGHAVRRALAGTLGAVARGLSASARIVEQASWILRPREPVAPASPPAADDVTESQPADLDDLEAAETVEPAVAADLAAAPEPAATVGSEPLEPEDFEGPEPPVTDVDPEPEAPPTVSAPEGPDRVRVAETHIAALAERPVADVVAALDGLSTDELEQLYAYEVTHKNRKTVLRAIERAVQPTSSSP